MSTTKPTSTLMGFLFRLRQSFASDAGFPIRQLRFSKWHRTALRVLMAFVSCSLWAQSGAMLIYQQVGQKLVGSGASGAAQQGFAVALSADGTTLIEGGAGDNGGVGAAWVYTWNGSAWTQQGAKLVGSGANGFPNEGTSVAISADGNTAIIGGENDNGSAGAAWIFTRSGGVWTQVGSKLVGTGETGPGGEGGCVAMSGDGNTVAIGALDDNSNAGAVWIFTQNAGVWTQQGSKLVGSEGNTAQQCTVALSANGNTLLVGGPSDSAGTGAAWVFTRSGIEWSQQGPKLVGTGADGAAAQGNAVSLSADGNTAAWGGGNDADGTGAVWVFTRSGSEWSQQGTKLVGTNSGGTDQGSVSLSADGNTLMDGSPFVNSAVGGAWIFTRSAGVWSQQGVVLSGSGSSGFSLQGAVALSGDALTFALGGQDDGDGTGAAWVFNRNVDFGAVNETGSATQTISVLFLSNFMLGNITVQTGVPTPIFTLAGSQPEGACATGVTYTAGEICTLTVQFAPDESGLLLGSLLLYDNSEALQGTIPLDGIGVGPLPGFVSGTIFSVLSPESGLSDPVGVTYDQLADFFIGDSSNNVVRELGEDGEDLTVIAGNGTAGYSGDGGLATAAEVHNPQNLALDGAGNLYFDDTGNNVIRVVNLFTGIIETAAGNGTQGYTGDGGLATSAEMHFPEGVAVDSYGNLYIADTFNNVIRKVELGTGIISTIAGNGTAGYTGDGGPAAAAEMNFPMQIALDAADDIFIADVSNNVIRRVDGITAIITTVAGNGTSGFLGDGGAATGAELNGPEGISIDAAGNLYISDTSNNLIRKVSASTGLISTVVGFFTASGYTGDGGPATQATLDVPTSLTIDPIGDIIFDDTGNSALRAVVPYASVNFSPTEVGGESDTPSIFFSNNGNAPLTLTGLAPTTNFTLGSGTTCTTSTTLNPGDSCILNILFEPLTGGSLSGVIDLTGNFGEQEVDLSGTGVPLATTTAVVSSLNPSQVGNNVTFTATVTPVEETVVAGKALRRAPRRQIPCDSHGANNCGGGGGAPPNMVSFYDGSTLLGTETATDFVATFSTSSLAVGSHNITAVFLTNAAYITSTSSVLVQVVNGPTVTATSSAMSASPNPATEGETVTLTATVTPAPTCPPLTITGASQSEIRAHVPVGIPDGECQRGSVSFYYGETLLGTGTLNSSGVATATTATLPAGSDGLTAVFSGNSLFTGSTSSAYSETITAPSEVAASTTTLTAAPNPATVDTTITLTATVSPGPSGTSAGMVSFYSGETLLGSGSTNSSGVATFASDSLPVGSLSLTAVYSGDAALAASTSAVFTETINSAYTVTAPPAPVNVPQGGSVEINVTVPPLGGAFNSVVTLSASGLPPGATATFNPPTVTPGAKGAPTVMTIQLAPMAAALFDPGEGPPLRHLPLGMLALALGLCSVGFGSKRRWRGRMLAVVMLLAVAGVQIGCDGGFMGPATTPPNTYMVTVTGTSGSLHASTTVTVVVQ